MQFSRTTDSRRFIDAARLRRIETRMKRRRLSIGTTAFFRDGTRINAVRILQLRAHMCRRRLKVEAVEFHDDHGRIGKCMLNMAALFLSLPQAAEPRRGEGGSTASAVETGGVLQ
ncbi:hypothetical protein [Tardiphaga robiniae]|uniref:hypothetical protein n=1 Tax=Tardiphaga robiniae TaxID=943830 RepID=UPI001111AF85|nr:hypothetical protein [Tardiphaga robiniae]